MMRHKSTALAQRPRADLEQKRARSVLSTTKPQASGPRIEPDCMVGRKTDVGGLVGLRLDEVFEGNGEDERHARRLEGREVRIVVTAVRRTAIARR